MAEDDDKKSGHTMAEHHGMGPGWAHEQPYLSLVPVNGLARTISSNAGVLSDPGMTRAAKFTQGCVRLAR